MPALSSALSQYTQPATNYTNFYGQNLAVGTPEQIQAGMTRQQFADYVGTFLPYEDKYIEYAMDPTQAATAMQSAQQNVSSAFDRQAAATERRLRPLGGLSPEQQVVANRSLALARAAATSGAANRARDLTLQRQQAILGGGL